MNSLPTSMTLIRRYLDRVFNLFKWVSIAAASYSVFLVHMTAGIVKVVC